MEERTRTRGLVGDDDRVFEFYDARVPESVATARDFEAWWNTAGKKSPKLLHLQKSDLIVADAATAAETAAAADAEFPREWRSGDQRLALKYRFDPAADDDGVTVAVPLPLLPRLEPESFEQLVPGMRQELVTGLIRTLPKAIRKHVVPANDWAKTLLSAITADLENENVTASLTELLAAEIRRRTSVPATAADFDAERLPQHLRPTFRVVDARGRTVARGKDLARLQREHSGSCLLYTSDAADE